MHKSLSELAEIVNGEVDGDPDIAISGAADIEDARAGDIVFAESAKLLEKAHHSEASAVITQKGARNSVKPLITVKNPRYAFAQVLEVFSPVKDRQSGIHPAAFIGQDTVIGENPSVGFGAHIGGSSRVGNNVWIHPLAYIGDNVQIGDDAVIYPCAAVLDDVKIGDRAIVHGGTVIGADGFGYTRVGDRHYKIPQVGTIIIGDDVEIGANVTIDRARTGTTEIGSGTKIDNLVHIAHNVQIGENCVIIAQVGISGSVEIGDRVVIAGQAGVNPHIVIGNDCVVCGKSGVISNVETGSCVSGFPARPHKEQMRLQAAQQRLPGMLKQIRDLEKRIKELEDRLSQ